MDNLHFRARAHRNVVNLAALLTRNNGGQQDVVVDDLSLDGCKINGNFSVGDKVQIKLPRIGTLTGQVRWSVFGRAGLRFIRSVDR